MFRSFDRFHLAVMNPSVSVSRESDDVSSVRCARCRRVFDCGARGDRSACWCASMPALPTDSLEPASGCLCPECLADAIARAQAAAPK
jgi:hypothetical protein